MKSLFLLSLILIFCVYLTPNCEALNQQSLTLSAQRHLKREIVGNSGTTAGGWLLYVTGLTTTFVAANLILDAIRKPRTPKRLRH